MPSGRIGASPDPVDGPERNPQRHTGTVCCGDPCGGVPWFASVSVRLLTELAVSTRLRVAVSGVRPVGSAPLGCASHAHSSLPAPTVVAATVGADRGPGWSASATVRLRCASAPRPLWSVLVTVPLRRASPVGTNRPLRTVPGVLPRSSPPTRASSGRRPPAHGGPVAVHHPRGSGRRHALGSARRSACGQVSPGGRRAAGSSTRRRTRPVPPVRRRRERWRRRRRRTGPAPPPWRRSSGGPVRRCAGPPRGRVVR